MGVVKKNKLSYTSSSSGPVVSSTRSTGNQMLDTTPGRVVPTAEQIKGSSTAFDATPIKAATSGIPDMVSTGIGLKSTSTGPIAGTLSDEEWGGGSSSKKSSSSSGYSYKPYKSNFEYTPFSYSGPSWQDVQKPEREEFTYKQFEVPEFQPGQLTVDYKAKMQDAEGAKPGPYKSQYEGAIQTILDGILNGGQKPFDATTDPNYNMLYNQAREKYTTAGQKAMRDTMGQMQAMTGGYGSTAAQIAGGQAYDSYLQALNDQNADLVNLAWQMAQEQTADRYRQLGAVTDADATAYGRYSDDYNRWLQDRDYAANQYQQMLNNDWNQYTYGTNLAYDNYTGNRAMDWNIYQDDANRDWQEYQDAVNRAYQAERDARGDWEYDNNFAYQQDRDARSDWQYDNSFNYNAYRDSIADQQYEAEQAYKRSRDDIADSRYDTEFEYQMSRDDLADRDNAFSMAYKMASAGQQVPAMYAKMLDEETLAQLQALAAQAAAEKAAGGSGGGGRGGRGRSKSTKDDTTTTVLRTGLPYKSTNLGYIDDMYNVADAAYGTGSRAQAQRVIGNAIDNEEIVPEQADIIRNALGLDLTGVEGGYKVDPVGVREGILMKDSYQNIADINKARKKRS